MANPVDDKWMPMSLRMPTDLLTALDEERKLVRLERPGEAISRADILRALAYEALKIRHRRRSSG